MDIKKVYAPLFILEQNDERRISVTFVHDKRPLNKEVFFYVTHVTSTLNL